MSEQPLATQEYVGNPANFRAPLPYEEAKAPTRIEVQDVSEPVEPNAEPEAVAPAPSPAESLPEVEQPPEILELREQLDRQNQDQERRHQEVLARLDSLTQQIQALVEHLAPPPPGEEEPPPPEDPAAEVLTARPTLEQALNDATNRLAKVKNRLEGRMLFPVRFDREKADNQEYEQARQEYDQALAALIANHRQEHGINNMPENEISSNLSRLVIESDLKLAEAQQSINEQNMQEALAAGGVKGKFREFVHWWAKLPTWRKLDLAA